MNKLEKLALMEGYEDVMDLLDAVHIDSVVPGICKTIGCDYSTEVEPDSNSGWCEECEKNTVVSCLVLAGII